MLDFYRAHQVSPVTQAIPDLDAHFTRRAFLYRSLGLSPIAIEGKSVLEVGPGSGQNALYTASLSPKRYVLMEPNETGRQALKKTLQGRAVEISPCALEETAPLWETFDVVLCEGLLGLAGGNARELLAKVGAKVRIGGVLVITCIDAISQCSDVLRRAMAQKYIKRDASLQENVEILTPIFAPHFATLKGMTRSVDDWIIDNLLNPASIGPTFSVPDACAFLEGQFAVTHCSPTGLLPDWRWYKEADSSNQWAIDSYWKNCHNLLDYRKTETERTESANRTLMRWCQHAREEVARYERGGCHGYTIWAGLPSVADDPGWHGRGQQYLSFVRLS